MRRRLSFTSTVAALLSVLVSTQGYSGYRYELIVLDKECNLCLSAVDKHLELATCDEDDSRQLWNRGRDDKLVLKKTYNGDRYCIQYEDDDVFLKKCSRGENDHQEFTYDKDYDNTISPKDEEDLCMTYSGYPKDGRRIYLKKCRKIDKERREWDFVDPNDYSSDSCDGGGGHGGGDGRFKFLVLDNDHHLCACINKVRVQAKVELCRCRSGSKRQQWILRDTPEGQLWRPRENPNLCACPDGSEIKLFDKCNNQQALWAYDENKDELLCQWTSDGSKCVSVDSRRRELLGFGTRDGDGSWDGGQATSGGGGGIGFGTRGGGSQRVRNPSSGSAAAEGDTLVLSSRSNAYPFELIKA